MLPLKVSCRWPASMPPFSTRGLATSAVSILSLVLSIVAFCAQPSDGLSNHTLPLCLFVVAFLWLLAALLSSRENHALSSAIGTPDAGATLLLLGGLSLVVELVIRLLCASSFGGHPAALDFGLKCAASAANATRCDRNAAFTPGVNSVGHCLQGTLSVLLIPSVGEAIGHAGAPRLPARPRLVILVSCFVAAYPIYNVVKRAVRGPSDFALSSFSNNAAEWAVGFVLGLSVGVAAAVPARLLMEGRGSPAALGALATSAVRATRALAGVALCVVAFTVALLFGLSWDNVADPRVGSVQHSDDEDTLATIALLAVPIGIAAMWCAAASVCGLCRGEARHELDGDPRIVRSEQTGIGMRSDKI